MTTITTTAKVITVKEDIEAVIGQLKNTFVRANEVYYSSSSYGNGAGWHDKSKIVILTAHIVMLTPTG